MYSNSGRNIGTGSRSPMPIQLVRFNKDQCKTVLRAKRVLANTGTYKTVYIEPYRSIYERKLATNMRQIVKLSPSLSFNKGKVVPNNHENMDDK